MPEMALEGTIIDLVEITKLLGVVIKSNLSWCENTDHIMKRGYEKIWML